jgi:MFS family permease
MKASNESGFLVRSLTSTVYVPNLLFSIGQGAIVPITALFALELGATPAIAGVIVASRGFGTMLFDLPAGAIVWRFGEKRSMVYSGLALAAISVAIASTQSLWLYAALTVALGCTWAVWIVARIAFATGASPLQYRGRVMSMIGGVHRIGLLVGPLAGAFLIRGSGLRASFLLMAVLAGLASASMAIAKVRMLSEEPRTGRDGRISTLGVVKENRHVLATAGTVAVTSQVLRSSREALIPLWGNHLGIASEVIPLIFAASAAIESMLFYPVGLLMDRRGRKFTAVPAMALFTLGVLAIPLTSDALSLTIVGIVMGIANGLGTGMNMTLGSDFAPLMGRSRFLSIWRLMTDSGGAAGPLLVAMVTTVSGLAASAVAVGAVGAFGGWVLWKRVPETLKPESDTPAPLEAS